MVRAGKCKAFRFVGLFRNDHVWHFRNIHDYQKRGPPRFRFTNWLCQISRSAQSLVQEKVRCDNIFRFVGRNLNKQSPVSRSCNKRQLRSRIFVAMVKKKESADGVSMMWFRKVISLSASIACQCIHVIRFTGIANLT